MLGDIAFAVLFGLKVCFICPFVVIDPTGLGTTTELFFQALCLFILNLSLTQNTRLFLMVIKLACLIITSLLADTVSGPWSSSTSCPHRQGL